jgi:nucleoside-diphosphate-sugar epimerase
MNLTRNRVLVTGGAGFLGSHLRGRLFHAGCDVLCVADCFSGRKENSRCDGEISANTGLCPVGAERLG